MAPSTAGDLAAEDRITGGDSADGAFDLRLFGALEQVSTGTGPQGASATSASSSNMVSTRTAVFG